MKAAAADNFVVFPFIYFPAFYIFKDCIMKRKSGPLQALARYRREIMSRLTATWIVWIPVHLINFAIIPTHLRVPFVSCVGIGYVALISMASKKLDAQPVPVPVRVPVSDDHEGPHL